VTKYEELPQMDVNVLIQTYHRLTYKNEGLETTKGLQKCQDDVRENHLLK